jgi:hypothetical protein
MLIEIWERLRGYDKWIQAEATIKSSQLARSASEGPPMLEWQSTCVLLWKDSSGQEHTSVFEVRDNSPLFQLYDGQTVVIRYNPANANEFYLPGVLKSRVMSRIKWTAATIVTAAVALFILLLH